MLSGSGVMANELDLGKEWDWCFAGTSGEAELTMIQM